MNLSTVAIISSLSIFMLSGCATNTIKSKDAQIYKGVSIERFLSERFMEKRYESTGLVQDEYLVYIAPFTSMNYHYLYRPYEEFKVFCEVNGGKVVQDVQYKDNPMSQFIKNPYIEYQKAYSSVKEGGYNEEISNSVAFSAQLDSRRHNSWLGSDSDGKVLEKAIFQDKIFGSFSCHTQDNKLAAVNIIPVKFKPRNPRNQLEPADLYIGIGILSE